MAKFVKDCVLLAEQTNEQDQSRASTSEQQLKEVAERVYQRYGTNLAAFLRDIQIQRDNAAKRGA